MRESKKVEKDKPDRCPKCFSKKRCKNGFNYGRQRYRCGKCGFNYTVSYRGVDPTIKIDVIEWYEERQGMLLIGQRTEEDVFGKIEPDEDYTPKSPVVGEDKRKRKREFFSLRHTAEAHGVSNVSVINWGRKSGVESNWNKKKG